MSAELEVGSKFKMGPVGMTVVADSKPTYAQWEIALNVLTGLTRSIPWALGDMLLIGEHTYGQKYSQALESTGLEYGYLRDLSYVCGNVQLSVRTDKLSFSHHRLVAPLEQPDQVKWLNLAVKNKWTVAQMREAMGGKEDEEDTPDEADVVERVLAIIGKVEAEYRHDLIRELIQRLREMDRGGEA